MSHKSKPQKKNNRTGFIINTVLIIFLLLLFWFLIRQIRLQSQFGDTRLPHNTCPHIENAEMARVQPGTPEQILRRTGYTVSYNKQWKLPNWVSYELLQGELKGDEERSETFFTDTEVSGTAATTRDYTRSGYDRGHMAPAADMKWDPVAMKESFLMTNICPQTPELNRGRWKELEEAVRLWARQDSALLITCGPIVNKRTKTIGQNKIAVPTRFFKVIAAPYLSRPRGIAFIFENGTSHPSLRELAITIDSVEKITGIDFFHNLPDSIENEIEKNLQIDQWNLN